MDINKIKRKKRKRTVLVSIRITQEASKWLKENNYSPTAIFNEAMKDLGFRDEDKC
jgi:hypothetical protein